MTNVDKALEIKTFGRLTVQGKVDSMRVWVRCSCGLRGLYIVYAAKLFADPKPLRNCCKCGYVASSGEAKREARMKVPASARKQIAGLGGDAKRRRYGYGREIADLCRRMAADGMTQAEIAQIVGVSTVTIGLWVTGKLYADEE